MAAAISRRAALAVLGVGLGTALVACDSARNGTDPTANPGPGPSGTVGQGNDEPAATAAEVPDSAALLAALARAEELAANSRAITGARGALERVHQQVQRALDEQARVLADVLRAGGVQVPQTQVPSPIATPGPGDSATQTGAGATGDSAAQTSPGAAGDSTTQTGAGTAEAQAAQAGAQLTKLGRACRDDVSPTALAALGEISAANLPMLLSIAGQRGATAQVLATAPDWPPLDGPTGSACVASLAAFREAVYGFEVLAARSADEERKRYADVLGQLRLLTRELTSLAGPAAPPAPLGYGLPGPLGNQEARADLAGSLMAALPQTLLAPSGGFAGDPVATSGTVRLLADAVRLGRHWTPITAFPGLALPSA